jgi:hypothetical protein
MGRLDVRREETIHEPVEVVWRYVAEEYFAHHAQWDTAIAGMEQLTEGPVATGTRGVETRRFMGKQKAEFQVTEFEPSRHFAFENTSGPFEVSRSYTLTEVEDGTRLSFRFVMAPKGPAKLMFPLVRGTIERQVGENIARIPALVESTTS